MSTSDHGRARVLAHTIRLGSQWECFLLPTDQRTSAASPDAPTEGAGPTPRLKNVADWAEMAGREFQGWLRLVRRFGRPSGLAADNRIVLVIDSLARTSSVTFNGHLLGTTPSEGVEVDPEPSVLRFDVSAELQSRNQLLVEVDVPDMRTSPRLMRDVFLEILT